MSERPLAETARLKVAELTDEIAAVVVATAGVVRLEPSLKSALGQLAVTSKATAAVDGVHVVSRGEVTEVSVDIATSGTLPALASAELVQQRIQDAIRQAGHQPGSVTVSVLAVERDQPLGG